MVPPGSIQAEAYDVHDGDLERPVRLATDPRAHGEHPVVVEREDVLQTKARVRSEIHERANARYVLLTRERGEESERPVVLHDEARSENRGELLPVASCQRGEEAEARLPGGGVRGGLARAVARVELGVRGVEVVRIERHERRDLAPLVRLDDLQILG